MLAVCHVPGGRAGLLPGEDVALIRPYVLTPEERQERRLQHAQQWAPWRTVHEANAGPRVEVAR